MSNMIERVARAMAESAGFSWEHCTQEQWKADARAGIAAMREPTQAMLDEVCSSENIEPFTDKTMTSIYRNMIDAALK